MAASISAPAEVDCFVVAVGAGDRLQLTIAETSAGFTAFSDVRQPDGSTLCASTASPHHLGAMIPFCEGRLAGGLDQLGSRSDDPDDLGALERLRRRPIDDFRMF
ncbi:MAG: hypothetical protein ABW020_00145 [Candidatus Rokuibacteriota bacterium]